MQIRITQIEINEFFIRDAEAFTENFVGSCLNREQLLMLFSLALQNLIALGIER